MLLCFVFSNFLARLVQGKWTWLFALHFSMSLWSMSLQKVALIGVGSPKSLKYIKKKIYLLGHLKIGDWKKRSCSLKYHQLLGYSSCRQLHCKLIGAGGLGETNPCDSSFQEKWEHMFSENIQRRKPLGLWTAWVTIFSTELKYFRTSLKCFKYTLWT